MKQILPGLYYFTGLMAGRVYAIEDPDGLTIIDASIPPAASKILDQLKAAGRAPADVKRILITHGHPDHVGGLPALQAATGAEVYASLLERPVIQDSAPIPRGDQKTMTGIARYLRMPNTTNKPTKVHHLVNGGERLSDVFGGLEVVATPGHAPGHLSFWQPERKIVFVGDVLFHMFGIGFPFQILTYDMEENKRSIAKLIALEPDVVLFGHGEPLLENATGQLREFAQRKGITL